VPLLNNIATYLLSKKESPKVTKQFFSWNKISKIIIIAYDDQLSELTEFINACKKDNITVQVAIIYAGKPEQAPHPSFEHIILDKKKFSLFQLPTDEALNQVNTTSYDVLINIGDPDQIQALALSKLVTAKCKIARYQNSNFEITIDSDKTTKISDYLKQVIVYLNMINTTN
jgi:hypothetical protein